MRALGLMAGRTFRGVQPWRALDSAAWDFVVPAEAPARRSPGLRYALAPVGVSTITGISRVTRD